MNKKLFLIPVLAFVLFPACKKNKSVEKAQIQKNEEQSIKIESYADLVREVDQAIVNENYTYDARVKLIDEASSYLKKGEVRSVDQLLKLIQNSGAADSEYITEILSETFYSRPEVVINSLNVIEGQLLKEFRNDKFKDLLIASACSLPMNVTEIATYSAAQLTQEKKRLIASINKTNVAHELKVKVIETINGFVFHHE